ncbi:hemerythrin domain-containing protein [Leptolyngbya ohadii]|uniref:hemerythrin domain-containing protein n=1 Tax=Leptolyngbya ohadii TaxID=1962290 RepID=UPI0015C639F7|nr:hemerythrin domain-containing protein [Leptolyngbya ohadii]
MTKSPTKSTAQEDILLVLAAEHRSIEQLIDALEAVDGEIAAEPRFLELYRVLSLHHYGEQLVFYPAMREYEQTAIYLETAEEEHSAFKTLLEQMAHSSPNDPTFQAKLDQLKEAIMGHIEEEENEIFPIVRVCMNELQLRRLVQEYRTVQTKFAPKIEARICRNQKIATRKA